MFWQCSCSRVAACYMQMQHLFSQEQNKGIRNSNTRWLYKALFLVMLANLLLSKATVHSYYVITRLNPAQSYHQQISSGGPSRTKYMVKMPSSPALTQPLFYNPAAVVDYEHAMYTDMAQQSTQMPTLPPQIAEQKRSAANAKSLPNQEHVCKMIIRNDFQPKSGHEQNGTRVEIQQDDKRQFTATFVECESSKRESCHGIDNIMFTSECVTVYEFRSAGIRLEGSTDDFSEGFIKVPIACQCRLRRKLNRILMSEP